jgi:hypothetical protein
VQGPFRGIEQQRALVLSFRNDFRTSDSCVHQPIAGKAKRALLMPTLSCVTEDERFYKMSNAVDFLHPTLSTLEHY